MKSGELVAAGRLTQERQLLAMASQALDRKRLVVLRSREYREDLFKLTWVLCSPEQEAIRDMSDAALRESSWEI